MAEESKLEEQKKNALKILGTMLEYLGLEAEWSTEIKGNKLIIKITSEDAGRIIGRRGATLESLQLLLNRIMFKGEEDCPLIVLDIDGYSHGNVTGSERGGRERGGRERDDRRGNGGGRERDDRRGNGGGRERDDRRGNGGGRGEEREERREDGVSEEQLRMLALDRAKEVKRWGESVELTKMNAHDRRIIHINLQDDPEIETRSEGEGALKKVIISLKKNEN